MRRVLPTAGLSLLLASLFSPAASAGGFVGASAGQATLEDSAFTEEFSTDGLAWKAYGGFRWTFLALEGGYVDFGSQDDTNGPFDFNADAKGWTAAVIGVLPLGKVIELSAKAGVINWDSEVNVSGPSTSATDENGTDPVYGVGIRFRAGDNLAIRLEWEKFEVDFSDELYMGSAGLEIRF